MYTNPRAINGWCVSHHAAGRFFDRIIGQALSYELSRSNIVNWLRNHAWEAQPTGFKTREGQDVYRLAHPWRGPDAALVVKVDKDGTKAVVTIGGWEDEEIVELWAPPDKPDPSPPPEPPVKKPKEAPVPLVFEIPSNLRRHPEGMSLGFISPGVTVNMDIMSYEELKAWEAWLGGVNSALSHNSEHERHKESLGFRRLCKAKAHEMLMRTSPQFKKVDGSSMDKRFRNYVSLVEALGVVTRSELGEIESARIFCMARKMADPGLETESELDGKDHREAQRKDRQVPQLHERHRLHL